MPPSAATSLLSCALTLVRLQLAAYVCTFAQCVFLFRSTAAVELFLLLLLLLLFDAQFQWSSQRCVIYPNVGAWGHPRV